MFSFFKKTTKNIVYNPKIIDNNTTDIYIDFDCKGYPALFDCSRKNESRGFLTFHVSTSEQFQRYYEDMVHTHDIMQMKWARVYIELTICGILRGESIKMQFDNLDTYHQYLMNNNLRTQCKNQIAFKQ